MSYSQSFNKSFFLFFLLFLSFIPIPISSTELKIGQNNSITDKIQNDYSYKFYTITLDDTTPENTETLVIKVEEDKGSLTYRKDFSDVDIFVSLTNERPSNKSNSEWFSECLGDDIITISKRHIKKDAKFYIGVYCQYKCSYKLTAYLSEMFDISVGIINNYHIDKESSMSFKFTAKEDFEHLSIAVISPFMQPFKLFISDHNPSSQNTYKVEAGWMSGYTFETKKGELTYRPGKEYRMVVQAQDEDLDVRIIIRYPETITTLRPTEILFDFVRRKDSKCYEFNINTERESENIIINTLLFSGSFVLKVHGFTPNTKLTNDSIEYDDYTFEITSGKVIILTPSQLSMLRLNTTGALIENKLHFCIYSYQKSSYLIAAHYSSQSESMQRNNILLMGNTLLGYLPKGQVTRYRIFDFTKDSNITLSLDTLNGESKLYAFFSEDFRDTYFTKELLNKHINNNNKNFLHSYETTSGYDVDILNKDNICHSKLTNNPNNQDKLEKMSCGLFAIVSCDDSENNSDCIYRIRVNSDKASQWISPRTTYYGILAKEEKDEYSFTIEEDDSLQCFSVIQNTISGEATMKIYLIKDNREELFSYSSNRYYLPNVIHVHRDNERKSLIGQYKVEIKANSFSTYSIYYYTKPKEIKEEKPEISEVELDLFPGDLIQGHLFNDTLYKIYSYSFENNDMNKKDIRFTLTKRNHRITLYVFLDLDNFVLNKDENATEMIGGYLWKSGYYNQVVIKKSDKNYKNLGPYYLVIAREKSSSSLPDLETFTLGVSNEDTDLLLYEGVQHLVTLNNDYQYQSYIYPHSNIENPFALSVSVFFGSVKIYLDFKHFSIEDTKKTNREFFPYYSNEGETASDFITIQPDILKSKCINATDFCLIQMLFIKHSNSSSQYLITAKSSINRPINLLPGILIPNELLAKEKHYYIIEQMEPKSGNVIVKFEKGSGDIFLKEDTKEQNELLLESDFPNENTPNVQKGEDDYQGKILYILKPQSNDFISKRYLVTVIGTNLGIRDNTIKYSIIYSSDTKQINQNIPFKDSLKEGELHYYRLYFDDEKSAYISLTSTNGDADLYVNYGEELPTFKNYHWYSSNALIDYISFDKTDPYFVQNNLRSIKGVYTILVYGYTNSSYTLFATTHPQRIIPVSNNNPGTCRCFKSEDKCYFRYDNLFTYSQNRISDVSIAFSTNFIYGSGLQYVKLYNQTDYDIKDHFPSKNDYDWSNTELNKRNFLKVDIQKNNKNLKLDSMLLITIECYEKSVVELNSARISNSSYQYLDERRENLFYLEQSTQPTVLSFFSSKDKTLNYELYSYRGSANILVYQNSTIFNTQTSQYEPNYQHLAQFDIERGKSYYNSLNRLNSINSNIYFKVTPTENIGFFIRLVYEAEWTRLEIGKTMTYQVNGNTFYGFFDIIEEYGDIIISVKTEDNSIQAEFYAKVNIWSRVAGETELTKNKIIVPNSIENDCRGKTDINLGFGAMKLKQVPISEFYKGNIAQVHLVVKLHKKNNVEITGLEGISILVSPQTGNTKRIQASPLTMYFSNEKDLQGITIFDLKKIKKTDDIFVIQISQCQGKITTYLTDKIVDNTKTKEAQRMKIVKSEEKGKLTLKASDLTDSDYHLKIWGSEMPEVNCEGKSECNKDIQYLLYYFSTNSKTFTLSKIVSYIIAEQIGKGKISLTTGGIKEKDYYGNLKVLDNVITKVFISDNEEDFNKMGSLCFLQKITNKTLKYKSYFDPVTKKIIVTNLRNGIKYFINVLLENPNTGELFTFTPISFQLGQMRGFSLFMIFVFVIIITVLGFGLCYYYRKYQTTNAILKYENNDIGNISRFDKSMELPGMQSGEKVKYTTLTSESQ